MTGASAGIGEGTARWLAREGARVVMAARRLDRLDQIKQEIEAAGGVAHSIAADITNDDDRRRLIGETVEKFGRIDGLVNNAGYGQRGPIEIVPVENIRQNFETNLFSLIALTQLVIPVMREQGSGRIINISSVAGRIARPNSSVYDATKHALEAISDGMRVELAPFGIQVVIIEPGFILTEFSQVAHKVSMPVNEQESHYTPFSPGVAASYQRVKKIAGRPEDIAEVVVRAMAARRPRPRYAAPRHARVALALKRWLPERVFNYLLARQSGVTAKKLKAGN